MTLHEDSTWAFVHKRRLGTTWLHEWCLDCDDCGNHVHLPPTKDDPRLDERCEGWKLDVDGKDYCPECVEKEKK